MSEYMGGLPEGWVAAALGEVVDYGKSTKADPNQIDSETWVLELEDIERDSSKILQRMTFSERKSKSTKSAFKKGDVLYGKLRPYLNKVVIADTAGVCTTEIIPLSGGDHLDNHFLFHWLKHPTFTDYVTQVGRGVNMPRLGTEDGVLAPFILAPLAEQKVIADKLDALLAQVDTLKARLDAIPAILKRFRQSVLSAAVTGKLTEDWRSKNSAVQTISELPIQSKTRRGVPEDVRIPDRLSLLKYPESWALCSAAELLRKGVILDLKDGNHGANHPKTTEFTKQGLPFITAAQVTEDFKIDFDNAPKLSGHPLATLRVGFAEIGDVIFTHKGTVGRVAVTNRDCILSPQTTYYRLDQKYIIAEYLKFFLKSNVFVDQLDSVKSQTTRDFVPISTQYELFGSTGILVAEAPFRVPPL